MRGDEDGALRLDEVSSGSRGEPCMRESLFPRGLQLGVRVKMAEDRREMVRQLLGGGLVLT